MSTVLMVIHIIIVFSLIIAVLLQKSEGGTLGASTNTMGGFMNARGAANFLTRLTAILTTLFFVSSIGLALYFKGHRAKNTLLQDDQVINLNGLSSGQPTSGVLPSQPQAPVTPQS